MSERKIEFKEVNSSQINKVGYDEDNNVLVIEFSTGVKYEYYDVPDHIYYDMLNAASIGRYMNQYIRNKFKYKKIG
jgi:hypothetical protein